MDLWCYERILEWRGQEPHKYTDQEPELTLAQTLLRDDLANNKCVWTGQFINDMALFIQQKHSLISVFQAHPLHPFTKIQRLGVFLAIMGISAAFCALAYSCPLAFALPIGLLGIIVTTTASYQLSRLAHCAHSQTLGFVQRKTDELISTTVLFLFVLFGISMGILVLYLSVFNYSVSLSGNVISFLINYALSLILEGFIIAALFSVVWRKERRLTRTSLDGRLAKKGRRVHLFNVSYLEYVDCVILQKEHWESRGFKQRKNLLDVLKFNKQSKKKVMTDVKTAQKMIALQKKKQDLKGLEKWAVQAQMGLALAKCSGAQLFSDHSNQSNDICSKQESINTSQNTADYSQSTH